MNLISRQLELPVFEGVNPEGWLFRAERYFELNNLSPTEKIRSAVICLEGEALSWYYYEDSRRPFCSWEDFRKQLIERFQSTQEGAFQDQLFSLQQITTVREYRRQFEPKMMRMAQQIEDKNMTMQLYQSGNSFSKEQAIPSGTNFSRNVARQLSAVPSTSPIQPSAKTTTTPKFRRLSEAEMQEKREKGLCFRCDEKYGPGHRCKNKELQVLWMHGDELAVNESNENYEENIT
ncbi:uncharacterized protein LOC141661456 [Apium graveolens]|uniref:uncharacterized protein LOC141661456 n=1 Tax=Apium graveolens TaxID=4045 RepID=UPI003D797417